MSGFVIVGFEVQINVIKQGCWVCTLMENWTSFDIMKEDVKFV